MSVPLTKEEKKRRFFERVVRGATEDECWGWLGVKDPDGYAKFSAGKQLGGGQRAARISYFIHVGNLPKNKLVLHRCDNRECVNPKHLFLGTAMDNTLDMIQKGRQIIAVGSAQGGAKLTESVIDDIRARYQRCLSAKRTWHHPDRQLAIARDYGIDQAQISRIVNGSAWIHV